MEVGSWVTLGVKRAKLAKRCTWDVSFRNKFSAPSIGHDREPAGGPEKSAHGKRMKKGKTSKNG